MPASTAAKVPALRRSWAAQGRLQHHPEKKTGSACADIGLHRMAFMA